MSKLNQENKIELIKQVMTNELLEPYFFEMITELKDASWLRILKEQGFFNRDKIPKNESGYYRNWDILNYVKAILPELISGNNCNDIKYIVRILMISAEIGNYRVDIQALEIMSKIPPSYYEEGYLKDVIDKWIETSNNIILFLINSLLPKVASINSNKGFIIFSKIISYFSSDNRHAARQQDYLLEKNS